MKSGSLALVLPVLLLFLAGPAAAETSGYLSFRYVHGQEFSGEHDGTFAAGPLGFQLSNDDPAGLDYRVGVRIDNLESVRVEEAWLALGRSKAFSPRLGLYLVPFGLYNEYNRPDLTRLIRPPLPVEALYPERWGDIGIRLDGQMDPFTYSLFIGNGLKEAADLAGGRQIRDNNASKGWGGRFGLNLSRELAAGYSLYRGKHDAGNSLTTSLQAAHLSWLTQGVVFLAEYHRADIENPGDTSDGRADGYFVQGALDVGGIEAVASYQRLRYTDPYHGAGFSGETSPGEGIDRNRSRWSVGLLYRISPLAMIKFEYDFNREENGEIDNDVAAVEAVLSWTPR